MANNKNKKEKTEEKSLELQTSKYLTERVKELQKEVESLRLELRRMRRLPSGKIGVAFIVPGVLSLVFSILKESQILAFIGLSLTFWGALFFFIKPERYVRGNLVDLTARSSYSTLDRMIKDLKCKGKGYYIPPYPKDVYLPEYLKGLKEMMVFISADSGSSMPSIEEMAKSKFFLKNPNGVCITPPGLGLLSQFEKELRADTSKIELDALLESLPQIITENLHLAKEVEMKTKKNQVYLRVYDSLYRNLYSKEEELKSVHFLGCPLTSAVACAIAKSTGRTVTIQKDKVSPDSQIVEVWYRLTEG